MSQTQSSSSSPTFARVARAGLLVALVAVLCRVASIGKELFVAYIFGASLSTDAYALVMLIPSLSMALLVHAVRSAFLTLYPRELTHGESQGAALANRFLSDLAIASLAMALVVFAAAWWLWPHILSYASASLIRESRPLLAPAAGLVLAAAIVAALTAILNARGRYSGPQGTAVVPTFIVVAAVAFWGIAGGAWVLVGGLLAGTILQAFVLLAMLVHSGHGFRIRAPQLSVSRAAMWRLAVPVIAVSVLSQLNVYVDRSMASSLPTGAVAVLAWSGMLRDLVTGTLIGAFVSVLLPHFASQAARGSVGELGLSCNLIIRNAGIVLFPLTAVAVVCLPLVGPDLAFGRFDARDAEWMALCLAAYSIGFFADMSSNTLFQALLSLRRVRALLWISLFASFLPNIVLNLILMRTPLGPAGLALSTSIVGYLTLLANYLVLRRSVPFNNERSMWMSVGSSLLCAAIAGLLAFVSGRLISHWIDGWRFSGLLSALVAAVICLGCYAGLVFGYPGLRDAKRLRSTLAFMRRR